MTIGEKIRELRKQRGMTQTELAEKLKTTKQTIGKYEQGIVTNLPLYRVQELADVFGVAPEALVGWEEKEKPAEIDGQISEQDLKLLSWFRSLPPEKQRAILFSQDAPEGLA